MLRLRSELAGLKQSKQGGKTSPAFIAKVALSKPQVSVRGFADTWVDLVGSKSQGLGCSRGTISHIRDAFAEVSMDVVHADARGVVSAHAEAFAAGHPAAAAAAGARSRKQIFCSALLHVQDEASLRLRSSAATDEAALGPVRSRSSKVLQHALWLYVGAECLPLMAELDALSDKTALTLATALNPVMRHAAALVWGTHEACNNGSTNSLRGFVWRTSSGI